MLKQLEEESGIVSPPNEALVNLKILSFEVEVDPVALIERLEELNQHLLLGVANKGLTPQVVVLRNHDVELLGQIRDDGHVDVVEGVIGRGARSAAKSVVVLTAKELGGPVLALAHSGLRRGYHCEANLILL